MTCRVLPLSAALLWLTGCVVETSGPVHYEHSSFDRGQVETLRLNLVMGAGKLRIGSGTEKLLRADFGYSVPAWKPTVHFQNNNGQASMTISQPETHHVNVGRAEYTWDLALNRDVPLDLSLRFGAGEAKLDLAGLSLRGVRVEMGVGKVEMDLRSMPKQDYDVSVDGGVGEATLRLPADAGLVAEAHGGIGKIDVAGLHKDGSGRYVNDAYGTSRATIHVTVNGGIGKIHLIAD